MLSEKQTLRVLVVDDDPDVVEFLKDTLEPTGCEVQSAEDGDLALEVATTFQPDVVFLDVLIPGQDGWLVCSKLKIQPPAPAIVLITGMVEEKTERFAEFVHADEFLRKPFSQDEVLSLLHTLAPVG